MISVDGREMVDVHEAARLAGRTAETIRRWIWTGRLTSVKHGNKHLVARDAVVGLASTRESAWDRWLARATATRSGSIGASAADLVLEDRAERSHAGR
jgi:excisionase family DNA binding protein